MTLGPVDLRDQSEVADKGEIVTSLWSLGLLGLFLKTKKSARPKPSMEGLPQMSQCHRGGGSVTTCDKCDKCGGLGDSHASLGMTL